MFAFHAERLDEEEKTIKREGIKKYKKIKENKWKEKLEKSIEAKKRLKKYLLIATLILQTGDL